MYQLNHDPLTELERELEKLRSLPLPRQKKKREAQKKEIDYLITKINRFKAYSALKVGDTVTNGQELGEVTELFYSQGGMPQAWVKWDKGLTIPEDPLMLKLEPKLKGLKVGFLVKVNNSRYKIKEFKGNGVALLSMKDLPPLETDNFTPCYWENDGYKFSLLGVRWVYHCNLNNSWIEGIDYPFELDVFDHTTAFFNSPQAYLQDWLHTEGRSHLHKIQQNQYKQEELNLFVSTLPLASKIPISFGKTLNPLLQGLKTVTRRTWRDRHAQHFVKAFKEGLRVPAFDKDRRYGGKQIGWLKLTQCPYKSPDLTDIDQSECINEGFPDLTPSKFIDRFFRGEIKTPVWIIRFKFTPLEELNLCSPTLTYSQELGDLPKESNLQESQSKQPNLLSLTPTQEESLTPTSLTSPSTTILEPITPKEENSTLLHGDSPVQAHLTQEKEQDSTILNQPSGEKECDVLSNAVPDSQLLSSLRELSNEDYAQYLDASEWLNITLSLKSYQPVTVGQATAENDFLSLPTPTANAGSKVVRPAGKTRLESRLKELNLLANGEQLSAEALAVIMGFPPYWFEILKNDPSPNSQPLVKPEEDLKPESSQEKPSHQHKPPSVGSELITCPSCQNARINLSEGCKVCGWLPPSKGILESLKTLSPSKRKRSKGEGTCTIFKTYSNRKKYGTKYPQFYLQVQMGEVKKSVLIPSKKVEDVKTLNAHKIEVLKILDYIGSPKAYEIYLELEKHLKNLKK